MNPVADQPPQTALSTEAPPILPQSKGGSLPSTLWKAAIAFWKLLVGTFLCQSFTGSLVVIGWTYRLAQRSVLRYWWSRSEEGSRGQESFAAYLARRNAPHPHEHWPNWFFHQNFGSSVRRAPGTSGWQRLRQVTGALIHSIWLNLKLGVQGIFNTWVLTMPGCVLWLFAWYDGWNNSFNKGYEQAPVGPLTGILGIALFIAAMFYVPLAQARQAATGDWRAFYQFRFVWSLIRRRWLACLMLAAFYSLISVPLTLLKTAPAFFVRGNLAVEGFSNPQALTLLNRYFWWCGLAMFPAYVVLRLVAARFYARAILVGVQSGEIPVTALGEFERTELQGLKLIQVSPPRSRHPLVRVVAGTTSRALGLGGVVATAFIWFTFVAQIYIAEFFMYHPFSGWLNQPLVQLPWFHYIPASLKNPAPEILGTAVFLFLVWRGHRIVTWWRRRNDLGRVAARENARMESAL